MPARQGLKLFYRRLIAGVETVVCIECERPDELPAAAARMFVVYVDGVAFQKCIGCGRQERVVMP